MTRDTLRSGLYNVTQEAMSLGERAVVEDLLTLAVIYAIPAGLAEEELLRHVRRAYVECVRVLPTQKPGQEEAKA